MTILDELRTLGFEFVTEWSQKGKKIGLREFSWEDHGGWIYAFVVAEEAQYIGMTRGVLRSRMDNYRDQKHDQTTRLRQLIETELGAGRGVHIYGLKNRDPEAEESRLIAAFRPNWNR